MGLRAGKGSRDVSFRLFFTNLNSYQMKKPTLYFFFDAETNGLPKDYKAYAEDVENWPRVTQLCYAVFDESEQCIKKLNTLIKPAGWTIPNEPFFVDNGMTTERCEAEGMPIEWAMNEFIFDRLQADYSIAHNISFDSKILRAEMFRLQRKEEFTAPKICTMMKSTQFCQLCVPGSNRFKWPKLEELHMKLFGEKFDGAHDAFNDVMATAKCFFELKRRGVINLEATK